MDDSREVYLILGILLGAIISGLGYIIRGRLENKKVINEIVFSLLEIFHVVRLWGSTDILEISPKNIVKQIRKKLPDVNIEIPPADSSQYLLFTTTLYNNLRGGMLAGNLNKKLEDAVNILSQIDPLKAYNLSGNLLIKQFLLTIDQFVIRAHNGSEIDDYLASKTKQFLSNKVIKGLEEDILSLSKSSSIFLWWKCRRYITKMRESKKTSLEDSLDKYIDDFLIPMVKNGKLSNPKEAE